jgi:aryl-alcohol dehydrogenase-like predicted oxidoreductase
MSLREYSTELTMNPRNIGKTSLKSGPLGLGCNKMLDPANAEMVSVANAAIDTGICQFDGADVYGDGLCEKFFAKILKPRRNEVTLVTKFGMVRQPGGGVVVDGSPAYARRACEASLARLDMECIDLYYLHRIDTQMPVEEQIGGMADLIKAGKVREIGICNASADVIRRAHKTHPLAAVQMEYSLLERGVEAEVLPVCKELGITFVAYGPLTYAFLSGEVKSHDDLPQDDMFRRRQSRFVEENISHNLKLLAALDEVRAQSGGTRAQLALAWCLHRPWDVLPIPGSTKLKHLKDNAAAADIKLTPAQVARLDAAFAPGMARGNAAGGATPARN